MRIGRLAQLKRRRFDDIEPQLGEQLVLRLGSNGVTKGEVLRLLWGTAHVAQESLMH